MSLGRNVIFWQGLRNTGPKWGWPFSKRDAIHSEGLKAVLTSGHQKVDFCLPCLFKLFRVALDWLLCFSSF